MRWKTGLILDVQTSKDSVYDFRLYKESLPKWLPKNTCFMVDSGYQDIAKLHEQVFTPFKKPKGGLLIDIVKKANHYLARFCILVEHKIGLVKRFKVVAERYRNRRQRYDLRMKLFAGLVNFELAL